MAGHALLIFAASTLLLMPDRPSMWVASLSDSPYHFSPLLAPGGLLTQLALARWRRPEARLLAVMGVVPQSLFVYEVSRLFLVPRTRFQSSGLVIGSYLALGTYVLARCVPQDTCYHVNGTAIVLAMYLSALFLALRRPNEGAVPVWIERASAALPRWIRVVPSSATA